ncbi:MAG: hypothetical protein QOD00_3640 [Blastocatellia bacterium]|jgi:hypothetical protein|nr:hypothetical protein [Blastocatellia bacterium]
MADEVTYGTARAADTGDTDELSKAELQRRMEEARESISQTVAEIKDTVVNQYQSVKETVVETLDWREQFRKRPLAWSLGAMGAGLIVGYSIAGVFKGGGYDEDDDDYDTLSPESSASYAAPRSYAAQAITGGAYGSSAYARGGVETEYDEPQRLAATGADYGGAAAQQDEQEQEPEGPGLIERFKGTKAYDRLQDEVSTLGDRFIEELSKTAQAVVLPALFGKVKDLFGVDLSSKQQPQQQGRGGNSGVGTASNTSAASAGSGGGSSSSYATSENRPYGGGGQGGQS